MAALRVWIHRTGTGVARAALRGRGSIECAQDYFPPLACGHKWNSTSHEGHNVCRRPHFSMGMHDIGSRFSSTMTAAKGGDDLPLGPSGSDEPSQDEKTRLQPVQVARVVAAELAKDCDMNIMQARTIVNNLTKQHRKRLLNAILMSEYGSHLHGKWDVPNNLFTKYDKDRDGSISQREFQDAVTDVLAWAATSEQVDEGKSDEAPSYSMLWKVAVASFIPFMGFGFVDNFMMIVAGEVIEVKVGLILGFSTMAAAALGNLISDVVGLCVSGGIEASAQKMGIEEPQLSSAQRKLTSIKVFRWSGSMLGISVGCILGMVPLLFTTPHDLQEKKHSSDRIKELEKQLAAISQKLEDTGISAEEAAVLTGT